MCHYFLCRVALRLTRTPFLLAGRVPARSPRASLVTITSGSHVQPSLPLRARTVAVDIPGIALIANAHRDPATPAFVSPERPLSHAPHAGPGLDRKILPRAFAFGVRLSE